MKKLLLSLILVPSLASAQQMIAKVNYSDNEAKVTYGFPGLPFNVDCDVILKNDAGTTLTTASTATGGYKRIAIFTGLTPAITYRLYITCGQPYEIVNDDSFVTLADQGNASGTVRFSGGPHPTIAVDDRARIIWGATTAVSETPVQNTSCTSGCTIDVTPVTPGIWYREWQWQDTSNVVVGKGGLDCILAGKSELKNLASSVNGEEPDIPSLALWESNMTTYGQLQCGPTGYYRTLSIQTGVYYDAQWVMEEVSDYVEAKGGDPTYWRNCIGDAQAVYRDYVLAHHGSVQGFNTFTNGMRKTALRTNNADPNDRLGVVWQAGWHIEDLLGEGAAYCSQVDWQNQNPKWIREHSYCLKNVIDAQAPIIGVNPDLGPGATNKTELLYQRVIEDLRIWIGDADEAPSFIYVDIDKPICLNKYYVDSLYVIAAANALIKYDEELGDPGNHHALTLETVKYAVDWLWANMKHSGHAAIAFESCWNTPPPATPIGTFSGAGDLNCLYADAWAWVYQQTCDTTYRQQADDLFSYGVYDMPRYITYTGKHYNQSYSYSFQYVRRRQQDVCP